MTTSKLISRFIEAFTKQSKYLNEEDLLIINEATIIIFLILVIIYLTIRKKSDE